MTEAADPALAARARAGDVPAFEGLYRAHVAMVHGVARRILGRADAEDATQEVFVRAWERLGTFRGESTFGAWLKTLAIRHVVNLLRARRPFESSDGELAGRATSAGLRVDLEGAIEALPPGARAVFVLHDVEGRGHAEIAELLAVSVGTSKSQLHRARALLRESLREEHP